MPRLWSPAGRHHELVRTCRRGIHIFRTKDLAPDRHAVLEQSLVFRYPFPFSQQLPDTGSSSVSQAYPASNSAARPAAYYRLGVLPVTPRSPKRRGHRVASSTYGIASACARLGVSEWSLECRCGDFGARSSRSCFRRVIEPHRQRDPTAFRLDFQHLNTDDIAGLHNLAQILDVSVGYRGDVYQPILADPNIDEGAERSDVCHNKSTSRRSSGCSQSNMSSAS